jgi:hypothetical protein
MLKKPRLHESVVLLLDPTHTRPVSACIGMHLFDANGDVHSLGKNAKPDQWAESQKRYFWSKEYIDELLNKSGMQGRNVAEANEESPQIPELKSARIQAGKRKRGSARTVTARLVCFPGQNAPPSVPTPPEPIVHHDISDFPPKFRSWFKDRLMQNSCPE